MRHQLAVLAAPLLVLALPGPAPRAQVDAFDWKLSGCAKVVGDELGLTTCGASCSAEFTTAELTPLLPGTFVFDVDWSIEGSNPFTLLRVLVNGQTVLGIGNSGDPWCVPSPCSGALADAVVPVGHGETLRIELNAAEAGCGPSPGDAGTHCSFHDLSFTPEAGIWQGPGALAAAHLGQLAGPASATGYGSALAVLDDLDGDGVRDVAVGAHVENGSWLAGGAVHVQSGASGALLHKLTGAANGDHLGLSLLNPGDLDGDGIGDLVAGAPSTLGSSLPKGKLLAWSGATWSPLWLIEGASSGDLLGQSCAVIGDLDQDGVPDLAVGVPGSDAPASAAGSVRAISGADGALLWEVPGAADKESFGTSVAGVGDLDGDGTPDVLAGAPGQSPGFPGPGSARLLSGVDGSTLASFPGDAIGWRFGSTVLDAGDCDGDGTRDFAVGGTGASGGRGIVRVFSGSTQLQLFEFRGTLAGDQIGAPQRVVALGDVNGDGRDDLLLGMPNSGGTGRIEIRSGHAGTLLLEVFSAVDGAALGLAVAAPGDLSGDGVPDVLASAPGDDVNLPPGSKKVLKLSGVPGHHVAPQLLASSTLLPGAPLLLTIADGAPFAAATLVAGLGTLQQPFKGGTLVPSPDLVLAGLPLDGSGTLTLSGNWPAGLSGVAVWMQAWVSVPAQGFTASAALAFVAP